MKTQRTHLTLRLALVACLAALSAPLAADSNPAYESFLTGTVAVLSAPLAGYLSETGQSTLSVAAGGFRELVTGERSEFAEHLDGDLNRVLRDASPYGVPSGTEIHDSWVSVGGNASDLSLPGTLRKFGRLLSVDLVVSGYYLVQAKSVSVTVRLLRCSDGMEVWQGVQLVPVAAIRNGELDLITNSAPYGYGVQSTAIDAPIIAGAPVSPTASGNSVSSGAAVLTPRPATAYTPPPGVKLESNIYETEFSIYRISGEIGYDNLSAQNPTFRQAVHDLGGFYGGLNWADIFWVESDFWYKGSLPDFTGTDQWDLSQETPISSIYGLAFSGALTFPWRFGHHWVFYGGAGGRFESINISSPQVPSGDGVSFGNNSVFGVLGAKYHRGTVGLDASLDYDFFATYTQYLTAKLGLYYEYTFE